MVAEASSSNQDHYHITGGTAFSVGSSRFSLGVSVHVRQQARTLELGGLPPQVPIIGDGQQVDVKFTRWVFVLGYLFNH